MDLTGTDHTDTIVEFIQTIYYEPYRISKSGFSTTEV